VGLFGKEMAMSRWTLYCPHCNEVFAHSEITGEPELDPFSYLLPAKPQIEGNQQIECPTCHNTVNYTRYDLRYAGSQS
jgi:endogenous inhibitor of DNA gyrase (YacG/DUF329 family)